MSNGRGEVISSGSKSRYKPLTDERFQGRRFRVATRTRQGALRMKLWFRAFYRLGVGAVLIGAVLFGLAVGVIAAADPAAAQQIVVQGNRRVEASTIQSSSASGRGSASMQ